MSPVLLSVISCLIGVLIGWFISYVMRGSNSAAKLQAELDELQEVHAKYKEDVDRHFVQTSNLVNNLTQSYKEVHAHLSQGAQTLCSDDLAQMIRSSTTPLIADAIDGERDAAAEAAAPVVDSDIVNKSSTDDSTNEGVEADQVVAVEESAQPSKDEPVHSSGGEPSSSKSES